MGWWRERANQFAIKLALAGCLALYLSQVLALKQPVWSLVTVIMLMLPMYVGAVAEKSVFRALGTVVGGLLAVFLVGNFTSSGPTFLLLTGGIVMVCVYFNGGTRAPYAFFLTALTLMVVVSRTIQEPSSVWEVALYRVEEILLGIFCSLLVTAVLWPRYARDDFSDRAQEALRELVRVQLRLEGPNAVRIGDQPEASLMGLTQKMRNLIQLGGRESSYFRANSAILENILSSVGTLNQTILDYAGVREKNPGIALPDDLTADFFVRWRSVILRFADAPWQTADTEFAELEETCRKLQSHIEVLRDAHHGDPEKIHDAILVAALILLFDDIVRFTGQLRENMPLLMQDRGTFPQPGSNRAAGSMVVDVYWLKNGIRAGISVIAALLFCDWIQPPGASLIPVFAFLFPVMSRTYLSSTGDLRVFSTLVYAAVLGLPWALFVFLISPLLTNYLWMNVFLGLCLYGMGRMVFPGLPALRLTGLMVLNALISTFAINFQQPVTFFDIANNYLGFVIGIGFAAVFQRLIWPVLPQREFRDRCCDTLRLIEQLLRSPLEVSNPQESRAKVLRQIAEIGKWLGAIPACLGGPEEQKKRKQMFFLLRRLARVSLRTMELSRRLAPWPEVGADFETTLASIRKTAADDCGKLSKSLKRGAIPPSAGSTAAAETTRLDEISAQVFSGDRPREFTKEDWFGWMSIAVRHRILAERAQELTDKLHTMDLASLSRDPVL